MALFGPFDVVLRQLGADPRFDAARAYLARVFAADSEEARALAAVPIGETHKRELAGGSFALEQAYRAKPRAEGAYEAHRRLIDVQVVVAGEEAIEVTGLARLSVDKAYLEERDIVFFHDFAGGSRLVLRAGEAAVFFPEDAHLPSVRLGTEPTVVRKTVVKVPVASGGKK